MKPTMKILNPTFSNALQRMSAPAKALSLLAAVFICACSPSTPDAKLYFSANPIGPSANIYSFSNDGSLIKHTDDSKWRDLELDVADNGDLAYISNWHKDFKIDLKKTGETFSLFLKEKDQQPQQYTNNGTSNYSPKFSPDGSQIAYIKRAEDHRELRIITRADRTERSLYSSKDILSIDWSPDGTKLAVGFVSETDSQLLVLEVASGRPQMLFRSKLKPDSGSAKSDLNDDLKQVAYVSWAPDGERIAFIRNPLYKGVRQLFLFDYKTMSSRLISNPDVQVQDGIDWHSNGDTLLYSALVDYKFYYDETVYKKVYEGGMQIFTSTTSGETKQLTNGDHLFKSPVYSPDEDTIAYIYGERLGGRELVLKTMSADGENHTKLYDRVSPQSSLIWK